MNDNLDASVHSAKALMELNNERENEAQRKVAAENSTMQLASDQVALLTKANDLAFKAHIEAQESRVESVKSSKRAFWANIIAVASLIVATASLVVNFL